MSDPNTSPSPEEDDIQDDKQDDNEVDDTVVGDDREGAVERAGGPDILPSASNLDPAGPGAA